MKLEKKHSEDEQNFKDLLTNLKYNKNILFFESPTNNLFKKIFEEELFIPIKKEKNNNEDTFYYNYENIFNLIPPINIIGDSSENLKTVLLNQNSNSYFILNANNIGVDVDTKDIEFPLAIKLISNKKILFSELSTEIDFDKLYLDGFSIFLTNNKVQIGEKKNLLFDRTKEKAKRFITEKDISDIRFKIETFFNNIQLDITKIKYLRDKKNKKIVKIINSHLQKSKLDIEIKKELYKLFNDEENLKDIDLVLSNLIDNIKIAINSKIELDKKIWENELSFFEKLYEKTIKIERELYIPNSNIKVYDVFYNNNEILSHPEILIIQKEKIIPSSNLFFISLYFNIPIENIQLSLNKNLTLFNRSFEKKSLKVEINREGIFRIKFCNTFFPKISVINFENIQNLSLKNNFIYFIFSVDEKNFSHRVERINKNLTNLFLNLEVKTYNLLIVFIEICFIILFSLLFKKPYILILFIFFYLLLSISLFILLNIFLNVVNPFLYFFTCLFLHYLNNKNIKTI